MSFRDIVVVTMCVFTPGVLPAASPAEGNAVAKGTEAKGEVMQRGAASWYGVPYHGRMAASGEIYDMEQLTAAHRTLPFGTQVRVRRLDTNQTVIVRINDRGPFVGDRIIDLSHAAAESLGIVQPGMARVELEVVDGAGVPVDVAPPDPLARFAVQVAAFRVPSNAKRAVAMMEHQYGAAHIIVRDRTPDFSTLLVGECHTQEEAEALAQTIRGREKGMTGAFVVRLDPAPSLVAE